MTPPAHSEPVWSEDRYPRPATSGSRAHGAEPGSSSGNGSGYDAGSAYARPSGYDGGSGSTNGSDYDAGSGYDSPSGYDGGSGSTNRWGYDAGSGYDSSSRHDAGTSAASGSGYDSPSRHDAGSGSAGGSGYGSGSGYDSSSRHDAGSGSASGSGYDADSGYGSASRGDAGAGSGYGTSSRDDAGSGSASGSGHDAASGSASGSHYGGGAASAAGSGYEDGSASGAHYSGPANGSSASSWRSEPHDLYPPPAGTGSSPSRTAAHGSDLPDVYRPASAAPSAAGSPPDASGWSTPADRSMPAPGPSEPHRQVFVPAPDMLPEPGPPDPPGGWGPPPAPAQAAVPYVPPAPAPAPARPRPRPRRSKIDRRRLAVVYDVEGPRIRLGIAWFAGALLATMISPATTALVYAAVAGLAARQIVRAWGSISWQADAAAGLGALPVLAALGGTKLAAAAFVIVFVAAVGCAAAPDGARLPGHGGRLAAAGILCLAAVPALAGASFVLVRVESVVAAVVLLGLVSAYEAGDYIVGSGASNPIEGPLAGITTSTLLALPLALILVEPFDAAGLILLAFTAAACPLGQIVASAALPGAGAYAPALRRIDTLLILAPLWAAAAGAF